MREAAAMGEFEVWHARECPPIRRFGSEEGVCSGVRWNLAKNYCDSAERFIGRTCREVWEQERRAAEGEWREMGPEEIVSIGVDEVDCSMYDGGWVPCGGSRGQTASAWGGRKVRTRRPLPSGAPAQKPSPEPLAAPRTLEQMHAEEARIASLTVGSPLGGGVSRLPERCPGCGGTHSGLWNPGACRRRELPVPPAALGVRR